MGRQCLLAEVSSATIHAQRKVSLADERELWNHGSMHLSMRQSRSKSESGAPALGCRAVPADFSGIQTLVLGFPASSRGPFGCVFRAIVTGDFAEA